MPGTRTNLPDHVKLVNCAECHIELLGESMRRWARNIKVAHRNRYPQLVAGRIAERPYCRECLRELQLLARIDHERKAQ